MPTIEKRKGKKQQADFSNEGNARKQGADPVFGQDLKYGDVYSLLYGKDKDGRSLVPTQQAALRLDLLTTVKPRALLLLGATLYQICFREADQGNEKQQQQKSTRLRGGTILTTRPMRGLRKMGGQDPIRQQISREVRKGSHRFVSQEMKQDDGSRHLLSSRLLTLLDKLGQNEQYAQAVASLHKTASAEDLLTRLLLLSVVGSDEGWNWVNPLPEPDERILPMLMAPLTYQGITFNWSEEFPQPPLVRLWQKRGSHRIFQLIGKNETIIGGVGKTTALESLQQAGLTDETVWLISLKDAYREIMDADGWVSLDQENHPLLAYIRKKYRTDITGWNMLDNWTLLLDGFNELTRPQQHQFCRDAAELARRDASIIIASRTDVRVAMDPEDYAVNQTFWDNVEDIMIEPLNQRQREVFFRENFTQSMTHSGLMMIVQNSPLGRSPFYLSMCRNIQQDHGAAAAWWPTQQKKPAFDSDGDVMVELMLHYVLEQIRIAGDDAKAERAGFLMTKAIPLAAYQRVRELTWQTELRQDGDGDAAWDDYYIRSCIIRMKSVFRAEEGRIGALSLFPEGQNLRLLRVEAGRRESLIQAAIKGLDLSDVSYGNSAALTKDARDVGARWDFSHDNIRDFLAALHVSNVLTLLCGGYHIREEDMETLAIQVGWWNNSILEQVYHLALRYIPGFGLEMCMPKGLVPEEKVIFSHIMSWLCRSGWGLARSEQVSNWCKKCYFQWNKALVGAFQEVDAGGKIWWRYIQSQILALCEMSSIRRGSNLKEAFDWACQARDRHEDPACRDIPLADGYQYLGQCKNTGFELLLNGKCAWPEVSYLLEERDIAFADGMLQDLEDLLRISGQGEKAVNEWAKKCGYRMNVANWALCLPRLADGMRQILSKARLLMERSKDRDEELYNIYALGYAAKALTIRAAIGTSGAALNGLGSMLQYQRCAQECSPKLAYYQAHPVPALLARNEAEYDKGEWYAYLFYQAIQRIQRGSQSYSACKMAELILRRRVSLERECAEPSQGPTPWDARLDPQALQRIAEPLLRHAKADRVKMSSFWYGRYCEERAAVEHDTAQRKMWLDLAEQSFDDEVRRAVKISLAEQQEIIRNQLIRHRNDREQPVSLPEDTVMRSLIEWGRIKRMRGLPDAQCMVFGVAEFLDRLRERLNAPTQRLKEGFVLTWEEVDEICWRYDNAFKEHYM